MICENSNYSESDRDRSGNIKYLCVDRLMGLFNRRDIKELRHGFEEGLNCVNTEGEGAAQTGRNFRNDLLDVNHNWMSCNERRAARRNIKAV